MAILEKRYFNLSFLFFLPLKDPFNVHHQLANDMKLMHLSSVDTIMVTPGIPVQGHAHILVNIATKNSHGSTVSLQFINEATCNNKEYEKQMNNNSKFS